MRRMLEAQEDVFYYVTVMNENYAQPAMPAGARRGSCAACICFARRQASGERHACSSSAAGTILREVLAAAELLEREHGVAADVWSVTSFTELRRDGMDVRTLEPRSTRDAPTAWVEQCLGPTRGPVVAASDYVRALPDLDPRTSGAETPTSTLGTDGFGRSDTRANLRAFFEVDRQAIVQASLAALGRGTAMSEPGVAPWLR